MKDKYIISLWKDVLIPKIEDVPEHFEEQEIARIGSNTMTATWRAWEPKLVENVNGTNTFSFKVPTLVNEIEYIEISKELGLTETPIYDEKGQTENPFLKLLINERKVKVFWKNKWYDLIIKNTSKDSSGKTLTCTCKDQFINELSKNGFKLVFDNELMNNQGTAEELGSVVLEGTDWSVLPGDIIQQWTEEPVYEVTTTNSILNAINDQTKGFVTIPANSKILIYYQQVQDIFDSFGAAAPVVESKNFDIQFDYDITQSYKTEQNNQLLLDSESYTKEFQVTITSNDEQLEFSSDNSAIFTINKSSTISSSYRAKRLVRAQKSQFVPGLDKYCTLYSSLDSAWVSTTSTIYHFEELKFQDATYVNNLLVNNKDFLNTSGWLTNSSNKNVKFSTYPTNLTTNFSDIKSYLSIESDLQYYNAGFKQNYSYLEGGFAVGEKYIFRAKAYTSVASDDFTYPGEKITTPTSLEAGIWDCEFSNGTASSAGSKYFDCVASTYNTTTSWLEYEFKCIKSAQRKDIYNNPVGLFISAPASNVWLEAVEFYPYITGTSGSRIDPGAFDTLSVSQNIYNDYIKDDTTDIGFRPINISTEPLPSDKVTPLYNENFEKIRSINAKESNRFNILQSIAETFECWVRFTIEHNANGSLIYDKGVPRKYIQFVPTIGKDTGLTFTYGIDLKSISRSIKSDQIVTKTIVKPNSNEFATHGMCDISRSEQNYSHDNVIYNFDYYINNGMLNAADINKDLYGTDGYLTILHSAKSKNIKLTEERAAKQTELDKINSYYKTYNEAVIQVTEQIADKRNELAHYIGGADPLSDAGRELINNLLETSINSKPRELIDAIAALESNKTAYQTYAAAAEVAKQELINAIQELDNQIEATQGLIDNADKNFYNKYSRFIQEGTWSSEDYIDDNLYYLDAKSVSYTSSRPKIEYNISVLRLSSLPEFKAKVFNLGDIAYVKDNDFFGKTYPSAVPTPIRMQVVLSEITSNFDEPDKDSFKVQTYKTQFEDLFQRITASVQSLQFSEGGYERAAEAIKPEGYIDPVVLQESILALTLDTARALFVTQNEAVKTDSDGVTVTDIKEHNHKTRLSPNGLELSVDGGETWLNVLGAKGLDISRLANGEIDTRKIIITDGENPTFRWDSYGIDAFAREVIEGQEQELINTKKFTRFDQFGFYGYDATTDSSSSAGIFKPDKIADIKSNSYTKFGFTWDGFFLKNDRDNKIFQIDSENDLTIKVDGITRLALGRIISGNPEIYGLQLRDSNNSLTLSTDDEGNLIANHITAAKISTSVFETGHVQAVGGAMLFKPTFRVVDAKNDESFGIIELEGSNSILNRGDIVYLIYDTFYNTSDTDLFKDSTLYYIIDISTNEDGNSLITLNRTVKSNDGEVTIPQSVLQMHSAASTDTLEKTDISIGINSSNISVKDILLPRGLTISEWTAIEKPSQSSVEAQWIKLLDSEDKDLQDIIDTDLYASPIDYNISKKIKLFLGDLNSLEQDTGFNLNGYGLYCNNAYLEGALITTQGNSYTGINTLSQVIDDTERPDSQIVIYAGATDLSDDSIKKAPFRVTKDGYLYAAQGIFSGTVKGSIITATDIYGSNLHAVNVYGYTTDEDSTTAAALTIHTPNDINGICFNGKDNSSLFTINGTGFNFIIDNSLKTFIDLSNKKATFIGNGDFSSFKLEDENNNFILESTSTLLTLKETGDDQTLSPSVKIEYVNDNSERNDYYFKMSLPYISINEDTIILDNSIVTLPALTLKNRLKYQEITVNNKTHFALYVLEEVKNG